MSLISKNRTISIVLSVLMCLALISGGYFFLSVLGLGIGQWLAFNACSVAILTYFVCIVSYLFAKKEFLLAIPLLPMYYYGSMGLFLMPWNQANMFPQITHIIITANVFWILYLLLKERRYESLGKGLIVSTLIFVPVFAYIQSYLQANMITFLSVISKM